jgi:hypothetical protein
VHQRRTKETTVCCNAKQRYKVSLHLLHHHHHHHLLLLHLRYRFVFIFFIFLLVVFFFVFFVFFVFFFIFICGTLLIFRSQFFSRIQLKYQSISIEEEKLMEIKDSQKDSLRLFNEAPCAIDVNANIVITGEASVSEALEVNQVGVEELSEDEFVPFDFDEEEELENGEIIDKNEERLDVKESGQQSLPISITAKDSVDIDNISLSEKTSEFEDESLPSAEEMSRECVDVVARSEYEIKATAPIVETSHPNATESTTSRVLAEEPISIADFSTIPESSSALPNETDENNALESNANSWLNYLLECRAILVRVVSSGEAGDLEGRMQEYVTWAAYFALQLFRS